MTLALRRKAPSAGLWILVLGMLIVAPLLGLMSAVLPWQFVVILVGGVVVVPLSFRFPEVGMLIILLLVFEVVPSHLVPALPLGGGTLKVYDMLFVTTALTVLARAVWRGQPIRPVIGEVAFPVLYVWVCVLLAWSYGKFFMYNALATSEARNVICWLALPLLLLLVDTRQKYRWLVVVVLFIAATTALYGSLQSLLDVRFLNKRVEDLTTGGAFEEGGVTRSLIGAGSFLGIFSIYYFTMMTHARKVRWWVALPLVVLAMTALAVSFTRAFWVGAFAGAFVAFYLYRGVGAAVLAWVAAAVAVALALGLIAVVKPQTADAIVDRATGFTEEVRTGGSFGWRKRENEAAMQVIQERPLLGVGLGGIYKKTKSGTGSWDGEYTFIHNGYLAFPLKMGLHAILIPVFFITLFGVALRRTLAVNQGHERVVPAAATGVFITLVLAAYTEPHWGRSDSVTTVCILIALVILARRFRHQPAPAESADASRSLHVRRRASAVPLRGDWRHPAGFR